MIFDASRVFRRGPEADQAANNRTLVGRDRLLSGAPHENFDAEALFVSQYETLRQGLNAHQQQGVLMVAFDRNGNALTQGWLRASLDKSRVAVVGRHTACGLAMPSADRNVSLRHLVVLVRASSHTESTIRIIDLHTTRGFTDETGQVLSAATAEGPMFVGLDGVRLVFLMTGEPAPEKAEDAYRAIPQRVLVEERKGTVGASPARSPRRKDDLSEEEGEGPSLSHTDGGTERTSPVQVTRGEQTLVRSVDGPVAAVAELCADDEAPEGHMIIRGPTRTIRRAVGAKALERGILVGRYDRCAVGLDAGRLSRVHFLITRDREDVLGIDTASTNGSWLGDREVSLTALTDGACVELAHSLKLTWQED